MEHLGILYSDQRKVRECGEAWWTERAGRVGDERMGNCAIAAILYVHGCEIAHDHHRDDLYKKEYAA